MKSRHKYLCLILPFVLLFTTAFAQQPTAPTDGQDTAQIAEQHQPDITVQPEATPGVALEVMPEQTPNQTAQPENGLGQASDDVQGDAPEEEEPPETNSTLPIKTTTIAAGNGHSLIIGENGTVFAAGRGSHGQLGNGTRGANSAVPVQVKDASGEGFFSDAAAVEAGFLFSLALKNDGTLWTWGCATGFMTSSGDSHSDVPVQVRKANGTPLTNIVEISAKREHWLALASDGTVWAWGANAYGQLGNGTTETSHAYAVQVCTSSGVPLTGVTGISAGAYHSMAVKGDGTVWTWGRGDSYQLCQYLTDPCLYATRANIYFDVVEVSAGEFHSMVLKNDGTVWCWGKNQYGQLGDGTRETSSFEVQAKGVYDYIATAIEAGDGYSMALILGGSIYAWGHNYAYQLGDGTQQSKNIPAPLPHSSGFDYQFGVEEVSCGNSVTLARIYGHVYAWGTNTYGEFGNGTTGNYSEWPISAFTATTGDTTPGEASINAQTGQEYTITATASGITAQEATFQLIYDATKLELTDFMLQRYETVTGPGVYGNLTVQSAEPGKVVFFLNTTIPEGLTWSGLLSKIKFTAVSDGQTAVELKTI